MKTKEELKKLAIDIVEGRVFGTWNLSEDAPTSMVFMTLAFMGQEQLDSMKERDVVHIYEHISEAGPRSVNGMPMFMSHKELTRQEADELNPLIQRLEEMRKEFANG